MIDLHADPRTPTERDVEGADYDLFIAASQLTNAVRTHAPLYFADVLASLKESQAIIEAAIETLEAGQYRDQVIAELNRKAGYGIQYQN